MKSHTAASVAMLALSSLATASPMPYYQQLTGRGEAGHGRPSVTRKKKAKTHGKNKKKKK